MTWDDLQLVHVVFIGLNSFMWFSLYVASTSDPGYLPRNILQYDLVLQQVNYSFLKFIFKFLGNSYN